MNTHRPDEGQNQIGDHPGGRDQDVALHVVPVLRGVHRHRLRAAEGEAAARAEPQQRRQEDAHQGIDVRQRVEGDPAQAICRVVSLPERDRRVGILMSAHRENQHGKGRAQNRRVVDPGDRLRFGGAEG